MGAFSADSFGNDEAMDWLCDLLDEGDPFFVHDTLEILADYPESDRPESWDCCCALAAAEMVAAAKGNPPASFPQAAVDWLKTAQLEVNGDLLAVARKAVARVASNSELKELWDESGQKDTWYQSIDDLEQRLA